MKKTVMQSSPLFSSECRITRSNNNRLIHCTPVTVIIEFILILIACYIQLNLQRALFKFAADGSQHFLDLLFEMNVDPNLTDSDGNCALHFANHVETFKKFRLSKADFFVANKKGQTALHFAALRNKGRIVCLFI